MFPRPFRGLSQSPEPKKNWVFGLGFGFFTQPNTQTLKTQKTQNQTQHPNPKNPKNPKPNPKPNPNKKVFLGGKSKK
jgi:hypothetical protein